MTAPLLKPKLSIPPIRPELVSRPRLIERLKEGLRSGHKLSLISAAAGFGKTTLVIDWLSRAERPFTWLSLDEGDNDPVRFLAYLTAALQRAHKEIGHTTQGLFGSPQLPPVELAMTELINDVADTPESFVLVIDDYHLIQAEWIHKAVEFLITYQPPQLHLVVLTRADPPLPVSRLRVRGQVTEIWTADLRFTATECAAFLNQTLGRTLDKATIAVLESRTEGWIAGLQLASLALQAHFSNHGQNTSNDASVDEFIAAFGGSHRHVIDYLTDEVLAQQPDEVRRFLCQTAILDQLTAPLCDALTGRNDSAELLKQIDEANLFLIPLDDQRNWYRYHSLFADFLRTELDQESRSALRIDAARWFADQDLLTEAVKYALESRDLTFAAHLIPLAAEETFRTAEFTTLAGWLDALPDAFVQANSELSVYKGFLLALTDRRDEVATYAQSAERSLAPDAPSKLRGRLLGLNALVAQCDGALGPSIQLSSEALAHLDEGDTFFRDLALNTLGQSLELQGELSAAADVYRDALLARPVTGNQLGAIVLLTNLVFALNDLGQRLQALELCQQVAEEYATRSGRVSSLTEGALLAWSLLSLEANELSLAREQALRALAISQQANIVDGVLWAQFVLARVYLANGEFSSFRGTWREAHQLATETNRLHRRWFAALSAQASLQEGNLDAAARWAIKADLSPADVPQRWSEFPYFTYARLLLAQQRPLETQTLLATMERSAQQGERIRSLITIFLVQARVHLALGQDEQALARVEDALRLAAPQDYVRAFLDEGPTIIDLLPGIRQINTTFVESVQRALRSHNVETRDDDVDPSRLLEPITVREQEILRLIAAGRSNPEIAQLLYLSLNTVKWHVKNLFSKLSVHNRAEAITRAHELDLL